MDINCLVIDDEPAGREVLEECIASTAGLNLVASLPNPANAAQVLSTNHVDILFLDIQMPRMSGLEFLRSLNERPVTILVTAHSEFALEGFELDVIDYLLKPVSKERFNKACNKAREILELRNTKDPASRSYFFIKCKNQLERINFDELLYVEASNNSVIFHTANRRLSSYMTFKSASDCLPADQFMKVHKSFVVACNKIESATGDRLKIRDAVIPVSRALKAEVMKRLEKNTIRK